MAPFLRNHWDLGVAVLKHCAVSMVWLFGCELVALCPQYVRADAFPCMSAPSLGPALDYRAVGLAAVATGMVVEWHARRLASRRINDKSWWSGLLAARRLHHI
jgi:hypothetical protein